MVITNSLNNESSQFTVDNIFLDGNTISTTNTNGNLTLSPNGTGRVSIKSAYTLPGTDGTANQVMQTDGAGSVSFQAMSSAITSWTPTIVGSTSAGTATYSTQRGVYVKIGRLVICQLQVVWSGGTGTGDLRIGDLPFTVYNSSDTLAVGPAYLTSVTWPANTTAPIIYGRVGTTVASLSASGPTGSASNISYSASGTILATIIYFTNS